MHPELHNIQKLLDTVGAVVRRYAEKRKKTDADFNIFRVCRVDHYETIHSAILAEWINPNGSCVLAGPFLQALFRKLDIAYPFNFQKYRVHTEFIITDMRRIDILIEDGTYAVAIENKIYASDQNNQLNDYSTYLNRQYRPGCSLLYYLTLQGHDPSEYSSSDSSIYEKISYRDHIISWLEECAKIAADHPVIQNTVYQYVNHLKSITGMTMDKNFDKELAELIFASKENFEAAQTVADNLERIKNSWRKRFWDALLSALAQNNAEATVSGDLALVAESIDPVMQISFGIEWNRVSRILRCGIFCCNPKNCREWLTANEESLHKIAFELHGKGEKSDWWITGSKNFMTGIESPEFWSDMVKNNNADALGRQAGVQIAEYIAEARKVWKQFFTAG